MKFNSLIITGLAAVCAVTSCVDENYDLSDIDTNVRVQVKDLIIPMNIDQIELSSVLELDEDDPIKIIDGKYCIVEEGDFHSSPVKIDGFTLNASTTSSVDMTLKYMAVPGIDYEFTYPIDNVASKFNFSTNDVPKEIIDFDSIEGNFKLSLNLEVDGLEGLVKRMGLRGITIVLPKGLELIEKKGYTYDKNSGVMKFDDIENVATNGWHYEIEATGINLDMLGVKYNAAEHKAELEGEFYIQSGDIVINTNDKVDPDMAWTLQDINLKIYYTISDLPIKSFSGTIDYAFEGINITDISLSDIPGFLAQEGTDLRIANPQIYVKVNNPMQQFDVTERTGITITSYHATSDPYVATLDAPGYFEIGKDNPDGIYTFCLSPTMPEIPYEGFAQPQHVKFSMLSNVLSGHEVPSTVGVKLTDPCIPRQVIKKLALGREFDAFDGKYAFVAPITLLEGSTIKYTDTEDGWYSDDLKNLTIEELTVHTTISTDLPIDLTLQIHPLDIYGNEIEVEVDPIHIDAHADKQDFKIHIKGQIHDLDGIRFTALVSDKEIITLSPSMKIILDKFHVKVTGHYDEEL